MDVRATFGKSAVTTSDRHYSPAQSLSQWYSGRRRHAGCRRRKEPIQLVAPGTLRKLTVTGEEAHAAWAIEPCKSRPLSRLPALTGQSARPLPWSSVYPSRRSHGQAQAQPARHAAMPSCTTVCRTRQTWVTECTEIHFLQVWFTQWQELTDFKRDYDKIKIPWKLDYYAHMVPSQKWYFFLREN